MKKLILGLLLLIPNIRVNASQFFGGGGSVSIGGPVAGGTDCSVLFVHPSGVLAQDNASFCWDIASHILMIGTNSTTGATRLVVRDPSLGGATPIALFAAAGSTTPNPAHVDVTDGTRTVSVGVAGLSRTGLKMTNASGSSTIYHNGGGLLNLTSFSDMNFFTSSTGNGQMTLFDSTGTLSLGSLTISSNNPLFQVIQSPTDPAGSVTGIDNEMTPHFTADSAQTMTGMYNIIRTKVDTGIAQHGGIIGNNVAISRQDASDLGQVDIAAGYFSQFVQGNGAKNTTEYDGFVTGFHSVDNQGTIGDLYDFRVYPSNIPAGVITGNRWGIFSPPDNNYVKKNWLSGSTLFGGNSFSAPGTTVGILGDLMVTNVATDTGAVAAILSATTNTTVDNSDTTISMQASATGTVQAAATNDKVVGGAVYTALRGDGTDDGNLHALNGSSVLMFHNSGAAGTTDEAVAYDSFGLIQQGHVTNIYDVRAEVIPAGGTFDHHFGLMLKGDGLVEKENFVAGTMLLGGNNYSAPPTDVLLQFSEQKAFLPGLMDTTTRDALTTTEGMWIYNTTSKNPEFYNGTVWTGNMLVDMSNTNATTAIPDSTNLQWNGSGVLSTINAVGGSNNPAGSITMTVGGSDGTADGSDFQTNAGHAGDGSTKAGANIVHGGDTGIPGIIPGPVRLYPGINFGDSSNGGVEIKSLGGSPAVVVKFFETPDNGSAYVGLKSPDDLLGVTTTYTLPLADGSSGQVLTTNASGAMSWSTYSFGSLSGGVNSNNLTIGAGGVLNAMPGGTITATNFSGTIGTANLNVVSGSRASPANVTAGTAITPTAGTTGMQTRFVQGSGGAVTVSANPQIAAGTVTGQFLTLIGGSNTNTLTYADGTGLSLNGPMTLSKDSILTLEWENTDAIWIETYRRN